MKGMIKIMKKEERVTVRGRDIVIKYKHLIPNKYIIVTMLFLLLVNAGTSLVIPYATMKVILLFKYFYTVFNAYGCFNITCNKWRR